MFRRPSSWTLALAGFTLLFAANDQAQTAAPRALITQAIDEARVVTLKGNTRPEATRQNDAGLARNDLHLDMYLQLKRSPEVDAAAARFVDSLTDPASANFHKWITAAEYGRRFGAAPADVATVSRWLKSRGFVVNGVSANQLVIDFSGTAAQVREALHTEIHNLNIAGKSYFANMTDPQIPDALTPAVAGVVSLSNVMPHPMNVPETQYTISTRTQAVVPVDLATIYNLTPVFAGGYTGLGQTIAVVEDTDLFNGTGDWQAFRQTFGLNQYAHGNLMQVQPAGLVGSSCVDPGINGDRSEAAIDVEWASAAAPDATIIMASCQSTTNFGGFIALLNMLTNGGPLPGIVSISYGESETQTGATQNNFINLLYQTAAAAGVSIFVSSGDSAAAGSDRDGVAAIYGIGVSSFASTPYDVAVGGTDFADYAAGTTTTFWNPVNGIYFDSAKSYIPEIPWNDSCGGVIAANFKGFTSGFGPQGYCNAFPSYSNTIGGSGGPSGCATGARSIDFAVSGTCAGYPKPAWQSIAGNPADGVRDLPDVALFASNGFWGHYYVVCLSSSVSCSNAPSEWPGYGGTSVSAPIMAGIQALMNQAAGLTSVGNPDPVYYTLGQSEFSTPQGEAACSSTAGPAATCTFNDIVQGDNALPCAGAFNCYLDGEVLGVLSTSNLAYEPAYAAGPGWDFATGIGSVNASNLLKSFVKAVTPYTVLPVAPVLVSPANGATGVALGAPLSWNAVSGAASYDVYLGTSPTPPLITNTASTSYVPPAGMLTTGTTWYWAIGARNVAGATVSPVWSFTTTSSTPVPGAPTISPGGVAPLYSKVTTIQPGEWVSIYGSNLATSTTVWNGDFPVSLGGTSVTIDSKPAYIWYVSANQINVQVPDDSKTGPVSVVVTNAAGSSTSTVTLAPVAPSFSLLDGSHVTGIILRFDGSGTQGGGVYDVIGPTGNSLGYPTVAAKAGDQVELFAVGLGPTSPTVPSGRPYSGAAPTTTPVSLVINNVSVTPSFAGLSGAGLYQINFTVPPGLGAGDLALSATVAGSQTPSGVVISLQ
jgi:uncharacterized protein (TIGR03437 family)